MNKTQNKLVWGIAAGVAVLVVVAAFSLMSGGGLIAQGVTNFDSITLSDDLAVGDDMTVAGDFALTGVLSQGQDVENTGAFPSVLSIDIDIDNDSSPVTCASIGAGEVWLVHSVVANVLDNFDTGGLNDATFNIGDGNDADGLLDLDDAELQAADTEGTGAAAGWQGFMSADTIGAYFTTAQTSFVYNPGAAETIDCAFAGTGLASDTASTATDITIYIVYTRIQ